MLAPIRLPSPATPRLNEPTSAQEAKQILQADRIADDRGRGAERARRCKGAEIDLAGDRVVRRRRGEGLDARAPQAAGVAVRAFLPTEQGAALLDISRRDAARDLGAGQRAIGRADRELHPQLEGVERRHLDAAARQGDGDLLRPALALVNWLTTQGGMLMLPLSPMIRPWLGLFVLVAGGGSAARHGRGQGARAGDVADVGLEVLHLVEDARSS